jgi:hypothetical protein
MVIEFDLQLFGGGGGTETVTVEKPVYQSSAPVASAVQTESATDTERQETRKKLAKARGRRSTNTGAGMQQNALSSENVSSAAASIAKRLLGE